MNGNLSRDLSKEGKIIISERKNLVNTSLNSSINESFRIDREDSIILNIKKNTTPETKKVDIRPYLHYRI